MRAYGLVYTGEFAKAFHNIENHHSRELAAAAMVDSIVRLLPGVLGGGPAATAQESFGRDGMLEAPQYTHPPEFRGMRVPEVLLSGDHARIETWRRAEARKLTAQRRPDLLK